MRAIVYEQFGTPPSIQNVADPVPTPNGVVVNNSSYASGPSFFDMLFGGQQQQARPAAPMNQRRTYAR